ACASTHRHSPADRSWQSWSGCAGGAKSQAPVWAIPPFYANGKRIPACRGRRPAGSTRRLFREFCENSEEFASPVVKDHVRLIVSGRWHESSPGASGLDGLKAMEVALAAYESARRGGAGAAAARALAGSALLTAPRRPAGSSPAGP